MYIPLYNMLKFVKYLYCFNCVTCVSPSIIMEHLVNLLAKQKICVIIEELNEYLLSMKFDSYYDDNLLQPEVGATHP